MKRTSSLRSPTTQLVLMSMLVLATASGTRGVAAVERSNGQTVYVPSYSEIPYGHGQYKILLSSTLTITNIDTEMPIAVDRVEYFDSEGKLVRRYLGKPRILTPQATLEFVVPSSDRSGGVSANFVIGWTAARPVAAPAIETIMIGTTSGQGISFIGRSRVISEVSARSATY